MAARVNISVFGSLFLQILLEYNASVSKREIKIKIVDLQTAGDKASQ